MWLSEQYFFPKIAAAVKMLLLFYSHDSFTAFLYYVLYDRVRTKVSVWLSLMPIPSNSTGLGWGSLILRYWVWIDVPNLKDMIVTDWDIETNRLKQTDRLSQVRVRKSQILSIVVVLINNVFPKQKLFRIPHWYLWIALDIFTRDRGLHADKGI